MIGLLLGVLAGFQAKVPCTEAPIAGADFICAEAIVTAPTMAEAVYKSVLFERTCMLHWLVRAMDRFPIPIGVTHQRQLKASLVERAAPVYWNGVVRALVASEPEVLR